MLQLFCLVMRNQTEIKNRLKLKNETQIIPHPKLDELT